MVLDWRKTIENFRGPEKLPGKIGISLYLRMGRLMGCPVCEAYFPKLARSRGFSEIQITEAFGDGSEGGLGPEQRAAVEYGEQVLRCDGGLPEQFSDVLTSERASQVRIFVRTSMMIHALGLAFLPHMIIERTRNRR